MTDKGLAPTAENILFWRHYTPVADLSAAEAIDRITTLNGNLASFWSNAKGWTPEHAEAQLSRARLDWQVELCRTLRLWTDDPQANEKIAHLILGWANLGALVEGSLKLYLAVWCDAYVKDDASRRRRGELVLPSKMMLGDLHSFLVARELLCPWHEWISDIQQKRNALHAFRDREIGTHTELLRATREYLDFLRTVNEHLPYPEGGPPPSETRPEAQSWL